MRSVHLPPSKKLKRIFASLKIHHVSNFTDNILFDNWNRKIKRVNPNLQFRIPHSLICFAAMVAVCDSLNMPTRKHYHEMTPIQKKRTFRLKHRHSEIWNWIEFQSNKWNLDSCSLNIYFYFFLQCFAHRFSSLVVWPVRNKSRKFKPISVEVFFSIYFFRRKTVFLP